MLEVFIISNVTFDWQIDEFMVYCRSKKLRQKSMASYEQALRLFERWCKDQMGIDDVTKVTEGIVRRYINDLQERGKYTVFSDEKSKYSNYPDRRRDFRKPICDATINNYLRDIRVFFNWLEEEYVIRRSPLKRIKPLKTSRKPREYISDEDFKKLVGCLDKSYFSEHRDYAMIMLMIDSGMRVGECSSLLVEDVNMAKRQIELRAEITKGRRDRVVYFSAKTEQVLRRWIQYKERYRESDYLFPSRYSTGEPVHVNGFESNFKNYLRRVGMSESITPHCLRNNFAKRCLMNGMDIYTLSRLLGHSSVTITEQAYLDLTDEDLGKRYQHYSPVNAMR